MNIPNTAIATATSPEAFNKQFEMPSYALTQRILSCLQILGDNDVASIFPSKMSSKEQFRIALLKKFQDEWTCNNWPKVFIGKEISQISSVVQVKALIRLILYSHCDKENQSLEDMFTGIDYIVLHNTDNSSQQKGIPKEEHNRALLKLASLVSLISLGIWTPPLLCQPPLFNLQIELYQANRELSQALQDKVTTFISKQTDLLQQCQSRYFVLNKHLSQSMQNFIKIPINPIATRRQLSQRKISINIHTGASPWSLEPAASFVVPLDAGAIFHMLHKSSDPSQNYPIVIATFSQEVCTVKEWTPCQTYSLQNQSFLIPLPNTALLKPGDKTLNLPEGNGIMITLMDAEEFLLTHSWMHPHSETLAFVSPIMHPQYRPYVHQPVSLKDVLSSGQNSQHTMQQTKIINRALQGELQLETLIDMLSVLSPDQHDNFELMSEETSSNLLKGQVFVIQSVTEFRIEQTQEAIAVIGQTTQGNLIICTPEQVFTRIYWLAMLCASIREPQHTDFQKLCNTHIPHHFYMPQPNIIQHIDNLPISHEKKQLLTQIVSKPNNNQDVILTILDFVNIFNADGKSILELLELQNYELDTIALEEDEKQSDASSSTFTNVACKVQEQEHSDNTEHKRASADNVSSSLSVKKKSDHPPPRQQGGSVPCAQAKKPSKKKRSPQTRVPTLREALNHWQKILSKRGIEVSIRTQGGHVTFAAVNHSSETIPLSSLRGNDIRPLLYNKKIQNWLRQISNQ